MKDHATDFGTRTYRIGSFLLSVKRRALRRLDPRGTPSSPTRLSCTRPQPCRSRSCSLIRSPRARAASTCRLSHPAKSNPRASPRGPTGGHALACRRTVRCARHPAVFATRARNRRAASARRHGRDASLRSVASQAMDCRRGPVSLAQPATRQGRARRSSHRRPRGTPASPWRRLVRSRDVRCAFPVPATFRIPRAHRVFRQPR